MTQPPASPQPQPQQQPKQQEPNDGSPHSSPRTERVPLRLQKILIEGQRGSELPTKPPPHGLAFKHFKWFPSSSSRTTTAATTAAGGARRLPTRTSSFARRSMASCSTRTLMTTHSDEEDVTLSGEELDLANRGGGGVPPPPPLEPPATAQDDVLSPTSSPRTIRFSFRDRTPPVSPVTKRKKPVHFSMATPVSMRSKKHISPHAYLTSLLRSRGYSTATHKALDTAYFAGPPTPLQLASFGPHVQELLELDNAKGLRQVLEAGLSPHACETLDGVSLIHSASRQGHYQCLKVLLDPQFAGTAQVVDAMGRSPLHMACLALSQSTAVVLPQYFDLVDLLLQHHRRLFFVQDEFGELPLSYIDPLHWTAWTKYLMSRKDTLWPDRCLNTQGLEPEDPMATRNSASTSLVDGSCKNKTKKEIPLHLALQVAEGRVTPLDALVQQATEGVHRSNGPWTVLNQKQGEGLFVLDSDDDEDDDGSEATFDEEEMAEILGCIGSCKAVAWTSRSPSLTNSVRSNNTT